MQRICFLCGFILISGAAANAQTSVGSGADAVKAAYLVYDDGWRTFNADKIAGAFADDFEWVNEAGLRFTDKAKLRGWLEHLFKDPEFRAGTPGATTIRAIHMLGPDVATVSSSQITTGQIDYKTHKPVPEQHTRALWVLIESGDSGAGGNVIHTAGWAEASLYGASLFERFA